jgi:Ca2+:H+ antiporter
MWICAAILPSAYVIGLLFSLHTHADMVWKSSNKHAESSAPIVYPVHIIHPQSAGGAIHQPALGADQRFLSGTPRQIYMKSLQFTHGLYLF